MDPVPIDSSPESIGPSFLSINGVLLQSCEALKRRRLARRVTPTPAEWVVAKDAEKSKFHPLVYCRGAPHSRGAHHPGGCCRRIGGEPTSRSVKNLSRRAAQRVAAVPGAPERAGLWRRVPRQIGLFSALGAVARGIVQTPRRWLRRRNSARSIFDRSAEQPSRDARWGSREALRARPRVH